MNDFRRNSIDPVMCLLVRTRRPGEPVSEELIPVDYISVDEERFVLVVEAKRYSANETVSVCR